MSAVKDKAVCIRSLNYSESSQIVTLFSRGHGKLSAIAKGSRRERSKFSGGIDILTAGEILFVPAHRESNLATLTEFELYKTFSRLRRELVSLNCCQYMCELLNQFTEELDPHESLYEKFVMSLEALEQTTRPESVLVVFELILLGEIGLAPVWHNCSVCGKDIPDDRRLYFNSECGGMLCRECECAVIEKRFIERNALSILRDPAKAQTANRAHVLQAHDLLSYHQQQLLGKETAVMKFVNRLLRNNSN